MTVMTLVYTGRIDKLEIGTSIDDNTDITNLVLFNWERIHDVRPRLTANTKVPVGFQQPHSWIIGTFSVLSDNHDAIYVRDVVAGAVAGPALVPNADSNPIGYFVVTYRDADNNQKITTFNTAIISRGVKELLNYDDSVWIYHFLAYFATEGNAVLDLMSVDVSTNVWTIYIHDGISGTITTSFSTPNNQPQDLTIDANGNLISMDLIEQSVYIHDGITSTVTTSFSTPNNEPRGMTLDSSGNLITSDSVEDSIYIHDGITDTITTSFSSPNGAPKGLTIDAAGNLISADSTEDSIYIHDGITDTITTSFSSPNGTPTGLSIDGSGNLLSADRVRDSIYVHVGITSTISTSFSSPDESPNGLTYGVG